MTSPSKEKVTFKDLLERELRDERFFAKVKSACSSRDLITETIAVDTIFSLIKEIPIIQELVDELEKISNKFIRYTEIKYMVIEVSRAISTHMKFDRHGCFTPECKKALKDLLNSLALSIKKQRDARIVEDLKTTTEDSSERPRPELM